MMRFHIGSPPVDDHFRPDEEGWKSIPNPNRKVLGVALALLIPLSIAGCDVVFTACPPPDLTHAKPWHVLVAIPLIVVIHELLHAILNPDFGMTKRTVIGFWIKWVVPYVVYEGPIGRNRLVLRNLLPFVVLTVIPFVTACLSGSGSHWLWMISLLNASLSSADLLGAPSILLKYPGSAMFRHQGAVSWWKCRSE